MNRRSAVFLGLAAALAACAKPTEVPRGTDGKPLPQAYAITPDMAPAISFRVLDSLNALRAAKGIGQVAFNAELNAAAATHSRDMAVQNRPWHFGSDGSSPLVRVQRSGYTGKLLGELISETFETELETLGDWMNQQDTRETLMDPRADEIGFAWFQESSRKIWWTALMGQTAGSFTTPSPSLTQ
ncbi:MAG: CAP domain-containing protein [Alphaproteobacteria bacterium]